nr:hypothetical protein [Candidatus Sigynarchaeum springense]
MTTMFNTIPREKDLKQKRTLFVADRVAATFSVMLAGTAGLTLGIQVAGSVERVLSFWWLALLLPFAGAILLARMRRTLYFKCHWGAIALLNGLIWFPLTIIVGLALDKYVAGVGNAYWVSVNLLFAYGLGYVASRWFGICRHVSKSPARYLGWAVYLAFLLVVGILVFPVLMARVVEALTGGTINMIHFVLCAFGVPVSFLLNYYMLYALHDEKGMNVLQDPPNKLFYVCLRNTVVLVLIFWVLLLSLVPPIAGGGGNGGGGGSSGDGGGSSGNGGSSKAIKKRATLRAEALRKYGDSHGLDRLVNDAWSRFNLGVMG